MSNPLDLLTKSQIIREYRYPVAQLDSDIRTGALKSVQDKPDYGGRFYIPRLQVENLIRERSGLPVVTEQGT